MADYFVPELTAGKLHPDVLPDLTETVHDIVGALLVAGVNTTVTYNDTAGTITIASTASGGSTDPEIVRDVVGAALVAGSGVQVTVNDASDTITIASTAVLPTRAVTAGTGLTGGGDLSADRTLAVAYGTTAGTAAQGNDSRIAGAVPNTRTVAGKALTADVTLTASDVGAATAAQGVKADSASQPGHGHDLDVVTDSATRLALTPAQRDKLAGIADGAEVNVNPDWTAASGDAQILNKPALGTAAAQAATAFATAAQGAKADSAVQPTGLVAAAITDSSAVGRSVLAASDAAAVRTVADAQRRGDLDVRDFGVVGDGVANDTAAVQAAMNAAITQNKHLYCPAGLTFLCDPLTTTGSLKLAGEWLINARTINQSHMLSIDTEADWSRARIKFDGFVRALNGLKGSNFGRSQFNHLEVHRCKIWGMEFVPSGNNNGSRFGFFTARLNGTKHTTNATQTAATGNVSTSYNGYATFTLATPIPAEFLTDRAVYFIHHGGKAYRVFSINAGGDVLEVRNFTIGNGATASLDIYVGGGLNIPQHGDNGVSVFQHMRISQNYGIGVQQNSLYGHVFSSFCAEGNGIGFACASQTIQSTFERPYLELNTVDWVVAESMRGFMVAPYFNDGIGRMQNILDRLPSGSGRGVFNPKMTIINDVMPALRTDFHNTVNPQATTKTLTPGCVYAYTKTAGNMAIPALQILNKPDFHVYGSNFIMVSIAFNAGLVGDITLSLSDANGETIEGQATHTVRLTGRSTIYTYLVGTDWKVQVWRDDQMTSIAAAPARIGQMAVVGGIGYMATGTAAASDWKQITN